MSPCLRGGEFLDVIPGRRLSTAAAGRLTPLVIKLDFLSPQNRRLWATKTSHDAGEFAWVQQRIQSVAVGRITDVLVVIFSKLSI